MITKAWTIRILGFVLLGSRLTACDHDCPYCDHSEPAAPYDVKAEVVDDGVHVTWEDASEIEDSYVVPTYVYRIEAINDAGSAISDEVEVMVP